MAPIGFPFFQMRSIRMLNVFKRKKDTENGEGELRTTTPSSTAHLAENYKTASSACAENALNAVL